MEWITSVKENARFRMLESVRMIEKSLVHVKDEEMWHKPNSKLNSMANLLLHLSGNIRQYIISSLGETEDFRDRDKEFNTRSDTGKQELLQNLTNTVHEALDVISKCTEEQLLRKREVQGFQLDGLGIVLHVVEHLSYHTGQIAFWVKYSKEEDLGFYTGHNLNQLNP